MASYVLQDEFRIEGMNPEGKKFEKVDRLVARAVNYDVEMLLDVHSELFQVNTDDRVQLALSKSEVKKDALSKWDYAMHGLVYKYKHVKDSTVEVHLSHGGLLARFIGDEEALKDLEVDVEVFTLVKKIVSK